MKIEKTQVFGFEASLRGVRNPLDSWDRSDSHKQKESYFKIYSETRNLNVECFVLGSEDRELAQKLTKSGSEHCKFLRQIHVWVDLTLPRYIWQEFDQYKFHTTNSCSTMHTAHKRFLTQDDFEYPILTATLDDLNDLIQRRKDLTITANEFIHSFKNRLPEGFLQKRTVDTTYAELFNIRKQRRTHRLDQWHSICDWIEDLPYFPELTGIETNRPTFAKEYVGTWKNVVPNIVVD